MRVGTLIGAAALLLAALHPGAQAVFAQDAAPVKVESGVSEVQMPDIAAPRKPEAGEQTGVMAGDKPFSLTTDPSGELIYNFNDDKELDSVTAKKGVVFTSEDMTLNADQLDYKAQTSQLVAVGKKVVVRQGEMVATCQLFKYFPDTQRSEFLGNPVIYNKSKDGKVNTTSGDKVVVNMVNGKPQIKVSGVNGARPSLRSAGPQTPGVTSGVVPPADRARMLTIEPPGATNPGAASGQSVPPAVAPSNSPSAGTPSMGIPSPDLGAKEKTAIPEKAKPNQVDPSNPADIQSFTGGKKQ